MLLLQAGAMLSLCAAEGISTSVTLTIYPTSPIADIIDISPDPRISEAGVVEIVFDQDISGLDIGDFIFEHNGSPIDLTGLNITAVSARHYQLDLSSQQNGPGSYRLTLQASGSQIYNLSNMPFVQDASDSWVQLTQARIVEAATGDTDGNGQIDQLSIRFDRPVDIIDGNSNDGLDVFTLSAGYEIAAADYGATDLNEVLLNIIESGTSDTGIQPDLHFINNGSVTDAENASPAINWSNQVLDEAAPVIVSATSFLGSTNLDIQFSEAVSSLSDQEAQMRVSDFIYSNAASPGASRILELSNADGSNATVTLRLDAALSANDFTSDRIAAASNAIYDASGNAAINTQHIMQNISDLPNIDALANVHVNEDSGLIHLTLTGILPSQNGSSVELQAHSSQPLVILPPSIAYTPPATTALLTMAPVPNAFGGSTITLRVSDNSGAWLERSFLCSVASINDTPQLAAISNRVIDEDSPTQHITLSGIAAGPANELQEISLHTWSSNPALIPSGLIDYTSPESSATLSISPQADAFGSVQIFVQVQDDGSINRSLIRSFTVQINPINDDPQFVHNTGLLLPIGASRPIASNRLRMSDDGPDSSISYHITALPSLGTLFLDANPLTIGDHFTQEDLNTAKLSYTHSDTALTSDSFRFTVSDGQGGQMSEQSFAIHAVLNQSDNDPPVLIAGDTPISWQENDSALLLDEQARLEDNDGTLAGGLLLLSITENAHEADRILLLESGTLSLVENNIFIAGQGLPEEQAVASFVREAESLNIFFNETVNPAIGQHILRHCAFINTSNNPGSSNRRIQIQADDGAGGNSAPAEIIIQVESANDAPVLTINNKLRSWQEGSAPALLAEGSMLSDSDSSDFNQGSLRLTATSGFETSDILSIQSQGTGPAEIALQGSTITYEGHVIGQLDSTETHKELLINFISTATIESVQAALRALSFTHSSKNPSEERRSYELSINDGDGASDTQVFQLQIQAVNDAPVISMPGSQQSYSEQSAPVLLDSSASCEDEDSSNFDGGRLEAQFISGAESGDQLRLIETDDIQFVGSDVYYNEEKIGIYSGPAQSEGTLLLLFNAQSTPESAQALLRSIAFSHDESPITTGPRNISILLNDGDKGHSINKEIMVQDLNSPPLITLDQSTFNYRENDEALPLFANAQVSDSDSPNFEDGTLSIGITSTIYKSDSLSIASGTHGITIDENTVYFNGSVLAELQQHTPGLIIAQLSKYATPLTLNALLESIRFSINSDAPATDKRSIQVILNDGDGDSSAAVNVDITVVPVNDAPQALSSIINTVPGIAINGFLMGYDPESNPLTYEIVDSPESAQISLLDASTGAYRFDPGERESGEERCTFRVSDGTLNSQTGTLTLRITAFDDMRPLFASDPPRSAQQGIAYIYDINIDTSVFGPEEREQRFQLIGPVPTGMILSPRSAQEARLSWTPQAGQEQHVRIGLLVQDVISTRSSYQAVVIIVEEKPGGDG